MKMNDKILYLYWMMFYNKRYVAIHDIKDGWVLVDEMKQETLNFDGEKFSFGVRG